MSAQAAGGRTARPGADGLPPLCLTTAEAEQVHFTEPWEARAFAMVVQLSSAGYFTWPEWVECFSREVAAATSIERAGGEAPSYYLQWLAAAEKLLVAKGVTSDAQLRARRFAIGSVGPTHVLPG